MQERSREFAVVETMNSGKPIKESRDVDVPLAAAHFFYYAGWADKLDYAFPGRTPRALGVAAQVIPWNFPLLMLAWKIAPALAAGNTVILKPASTTPLTAYLFADVVRQAELPPGVVNIITGPGEIGMELVTHPDVEQGRLHRLHGGRQDDRPRRGGLAQEADPGAGRQGGQHRLRRRAARPGDRGDHQRHLLQPGRGVLRRVSRLFAQESVYEPLLDKLKDRLSTLRVGDPLDKNTDVGAINSAGQLAKMQELVQSGIEEGAEIFQPDCVLPDKGFFFRPTLFTGVSQSHRIAQEEIFGPVLSVLTFRTPEEAIEKANNTPYGLSAGVWTEKGSRIFKMVSAMRAGVVWANTFNRFDPTSPFGGYKESGYGREGGLHGLAAYLDLSPNGTQRPMSPAARRPRPRQTATAHGGHRSWTSARPRRWRPSTARAAGERLGVRKTYKLYIGGEFPRTESGRAYEVFDARGRLLANACRGTRKDIRDAVRAARNALPGLGGADRLQPQPDPVPHRRADGGTARPVHRAR